MRALSVHGSEGVSAHQVRLAVCLRGGSLEPHTMPPAMRSDLLRGYRDCGRAVLTDLDIEVVTPMNALIYLDELPGGTPLMPDAPWQRAAVREVLHGIAGAEVEDMSADRRLEVWVWMAEIIVAGAGCLLAGVTGSATRRRSLLDAAAFPILHRLLRRGDFACPRDAGSEAALKWVAQCYREPPFGSSMTEGDRLYMGFVRT